MSKNFIKFQKRSPQIIKFFNIKKLTRPHDLQWCRLRVILLKFFEHPMHMDTSWSLIHRGALTPSSDSDTSSALNGKTPPLRRAGEAGESEWGGLCGGTLGSRRVLAGDMVLWKLPLLLNVFLRSSKLTTAWLIAFTQFSFSSSVLKSKSLYVKTVFFSSSYHVQVVVDSI